MGIASVPSDTFTLRPFVMPSMIVASELPKSQTLSVRFGAPTAWLPLPSAPWQAAQFCSKSGLPVCARSGSLGRPESERTYAATSLVPCSPSTAPSAGITPMRPPVTVSTIFSGAPP